MGGNLVLKLAGEWGSVGPASFRAVAAVCPAADLASSADALHDRSNRLYEYYFLMQLFRRFRRKVKLFPETFEPSRLRGISSMREFDDRITAHYCGFTGADDYYARASAANVIDRITVPTLIIHAANDPFIRLRPETRQRILANPNITYIETADGGHCAFLGASNGNPSNTASKNAFRRSTTHVFIVVVLNPNRSSSLNWAYHASGKLMMLNATPVTKRKPAIAQTDVPKSAMNFWNTDGNTPVNNSPIRNAASNTMTTSPKWLFARV